MSVEAIKPNKIDVVYVKSLIEVPKIEPFGDGLRHLAVIMDLDGVLCESGKNNTTQTNIEKLAALRRIAVNSDIITFDSSRMRINRESRPHEGNVIAFPFLNLDSEVFLRDMIKRSNPDCRVNFKVGFFRKERNEGVFEREQSVKEYLRQGEKVVFIGSSKNDVSLAKKIVSNVDESVKDRIYIFNTGHWII